jgi:hypothetical protein
LKKLGFSGARKGKKQPWPRPPFYRQDAALRETHSPTVPCPSTVTSKTPAGPLRARVASPPSSDIFDTRLLSRTGPSEGKCWGEGEDAILRSMPSSPRYTNKDHAHGARPSKPRASVGSGLAQSPFVFFVARRRLRQSLLLPRPHRVERPKLDSAHCNGPRADKHIMGHVCNSLFYNDGL